MLSLFLYNLNMLRKGNAYKKYCILKSSTSWSDDKLKDHQRKLLSDLLKHAYDNVPYYKKLFTDNNIVSGNSVSLDDFTKIPFLEKSIIRDNNKELKSIDLEKRKWVYNTSGGSTGEPVKFIQDTAYSSWTAAAIRYYEESIGSSVTSPKIYFWGSERDIKGGEKFLTRMLNNIQNISFLNAYKITPQLMDDYISRINNKKPVMIRAYAESIYQLAEYIKKSSKQVFSPKIIVTSAGTLYQPMRETLKEVFGCEVFNQYGSREVGFIAGENMQHDGLHINPFIQYIELVDKDGNQVGEGEKGEIVITCLTNYAMPLIRYKIGDIASWNKDGSILANVEGRVSDNFISKDGTITYGAYFRHLFFLKDWIVKYQIVQNDYESIEISIVLNSAFSKEQISAELDNITQEIRFAMGDSCQVEYKFVDDIPASQSGKYRYTISKLIEKKN